MFKHFPTAHVRHVPLGLRIGTRAFHRSIPQALRALISGGNSTTPAEEARASASIDKSPYYFETGFSIFAKRPSRPFPPPFVSLPSGSFSDPLTTHHSVRYRHPQIDGKVIRGITNGDDAIIIGDQNFLAVNDGVGAWAQKEKGHAALWSRLIAHFWSENVNKAFERDDGVRLEDLNTIKYLQDAYDRAKEVTGPPHDILGTTTASSALLHHRSGNEPVVIVTTLGDCATFILRPPTTKALYKSTEQWHWFDCPRQLGTNSPDTPMTIAVADTIDIQENDVVVVMSDGVTDNLWEHEICENITNSIQKWKDGEAVAQDGMVFVARELLDAAKVIAEDPSAESPYMERALDEGIAAQGGKLDDISIIVGLCRKRT